MSALLRPQPAALAVLALLGAMLLGWWSAGFGPQAATVEAVRVNPPEVDKPGWQALAAASFVEAHPGQVGDKPAAAAAQAAKPAAGPPPPDIAVVFRQDLGAVVRGPALLMVSRGPNRPLRRGQVYRDDWRLASLTGDEAVLQRGRDSRRIALFGPAAKPALTPAQFVTLPSAQQGQRPVTTQAANTAQPIPGQGFGGGRNRFGGGGRYGGRFGSGGFPAQPPAPAAPPPPTPPRVIIPGGPSAGQGAAVATAMATPATPAAPAQTAAAN